MPAHGGMACQNHHNGSAVRPYGASGSAWPAPHTASGGPPRNSYGRAQRPPHCPYVLVRLRHYASPAGGPGPVPSASARRISLNASCVTVPLRRARGSPEADSSALAITHMLNTMSE